jgi:hypothetical protein
LSAPHKDDRIRRARELDGMRIRFIASSRGVVYARGLHKSFEFTVAEWLALPEWQTKPKKAIPHDDRTVP